jgi:hypothetical protein
MKKLEQDKEKVEEVRKSLEGLNVILEGKDPDDDFLYGAFKDTDALVDSENVEDRIRMAKWGYGLDKLKDDKDYRVRMEVARQGYYTHILINDPHPEVRKAALKRNKD